MADRGFFHIIYRPRVTPPTRVENPAKESRSGYYWPSRHVHLYEDDDGNEAEEVTIGTREDELRFAIECHSHQHYADFSRDTWIVDENGDPVAIIRFMARVTFYPQVTHVSQEEEQ